VCRISEPSLIGEGRCGEQDERKESIVMDGTAMNEVKQWKCKNGHVLGLIKREKVKTMIKDFEVEYFTSVLIIFRKAIDLESATMDDVDVGGTLYGRMLLHLRWSCSVPGCNCARDWHPDEDALDWLQKRYLKSKV
jgi:hypothetical protein